MQSVAFPRLALHIARKDWAESRRIILALTAALLLPALLTRFNPGDSADFALGLFAGLLGAAGFGYAQYCFINERQRGTLELLLSLPLEPGHLVLAKYVSVYSMVLFTVNIPALIVTNLTLTYVVNAVALFLATVFMAATVVSKQAWAPQLPFFFIVLVIVPFRSLATRYFPGGLEIVVEVTSSPFLLPSLALALTPVIALVSMLVFVRAVVKDQR